MSVEAATTTTDAFDSMGTFMSGLEDKLGKSLSPLEDLADNLSSSKLGKNSKSLTETFKSMGEASAKGQILASLMKLLDPFLKLLKLLEIPIGALAAVFTMMVAQIMPDLIPLMIEFSKSLFELAPLFVLLGKLLAVAIKANFISLINVITKLLLVLAPLLELFIKWFLPGFTKFSETMVKLQEGLFKVIGAIIQDFLPLWEAIKESFQILKQVWIDSGGKIFGADGFIAQSFKKLLEIGKNIINGILGSFNNVINDINTTVGTNINTIPLLGNGAIATAPTLAMIGEKGTEAVVPLDRASEFGFGSDPAFVDALEENNRLQRQLIRILKKQSEMQGF
jgi:hypothetical protein